MKDKISALEEEEWVQELARGGVRWALTRSEDRMVGVDEVED